MKDRADDLDEVDDDAAPGAGPGPGPILREARESIGVSAADVAETLNLPERMVAALESESYDELPAAAFTRGYVRAYARLLELDADELAARFDAQDQGKGEPGLVMIKPMTGAADVAHEHPGWVLGGAVGVVVLVVVIVLYWVWPDDAAQVDSSIVNAVPEVPVAVVTAVSAARDAPVSVESGAADDPVQIAPGPERGTSAVEPGPGADIEQTVDSPGRIADSDPTAGADAQPASTADVDPLEPSNKHRLAFTFTEDCWVEVRDGSGRVIHGDLNRAGNVLALAGQPPFRITLGYAQGVELTYDGDRVALAPHTRNNVASLVLGQ